MHAIKKADSERDLGAIFEKTRKWTEQIAVSVNKANMILKMLSRTFESREVGLWKQLYRSMVRPNLPYAIHVWSPSLEVDISQLENIQRRATKIPSKLKNICYGGRLKFLGLATLKERRKRGDLIYMYKLTKGY